ncbi:hypothetical protein J1605_001061 [Eschrichtius robustus]|uniref:Uncharacterized protein n=1 Tax=Eschrichtius robustus TaxID=9764 RepID=A0AB34GP45_ESCRO|nr:hypothetical protein J1605_001061 [Eschrichtius robustus]
MRRELTCQWPAVLLEELRRSSQSCNLWNEDGERKRAQHACQEPGTLSILCHPGHDKGEKGGFSDLSGEGPDPHRGTGHDKGEKGGFSDLSGEGPDPHRGTGHDKGEKGGFSDLSGRGQTLSVKALAVV